MKKISFVICGILLKGIALAQPAIQINYSHLRSVEWDLIAQTYNTSRPWNKQTLIPLTHGYEAQFCYNIPLQFSRTEGLNKRALHLNPRIGYGRFASEASNDPAKIKAGFHHFSIAFDLRTHPKCIFKRLQSAGPLGTQYYVGLGFGFSSFLPFVKLQDELIANGDNEKYRELSHQFFGKAVMGYHLLTIGTFVVTPEIGMRWYNYAELTDFAESVNGHNLTGMRNESQNVLFLEAGIRFTYLKKVTNWWDKPRGGDKT